MLKYDLHFDKQKSLKVNYPPRKLSSWHGVCSRGKNIPCMPIAISETSSRVGHATFILIYPYNSFVLHVMSSIIKIYGNLTFLTQSFYKITHNQCKE